MFDINTLALKDTFELQLTHPVSGELLFADEERTKPVTITLYGSSSKQYRNALTAMQNRQIKRSSTKKQASAEVMREESTELLVACAATSKELTLNGKPVKAEADFRELFSDTQYSWVRDQVDTALGDTANFLAQ